MRAIPNPGTVPIQWFSMHVMAVAAKPSIGRFCVGEGHSAIRLRIFPGLDRLPDGIKVGGRLLINVSSPFTNPIFK